MCKLSKLIRSSLRMQAVAIYLVFAMASITVLPQIGAAGAIPTHKSAATSTVTFDREADMALIRGALNSENGKIAMARVGVTIEEMEANLGMLSDTQLNVAAEKITTALPAGGDSGVIIWGVGGVVVVVVVVVIILIVLRQAKMAGRY